MSYIVSIHSHTLAKYTVIFHYTFTSLLNYEFTNLFAVHYIIVKFFFVVGPALAYRTYFLFFLLAKCASNAKPPKNG